MLAEGKVFIKQYMCFPRQIEHLPVSTLKLQGCGYN